MTTSTSSKSSTHHKNHISEQNFSCLFILLSASLPTLATSYCWLHNFQQGWMKNLPILFKTRTIFLLLPADNTASSTFKIFKWKSRLRENARKQYWTKILRKFKLKPTPSNHHSTYITMFKGGTQHCWGLQLIIDYSWFNRLEDFRKITLKQRQPSGSRASRTSKTTSELSTT
jgi:hypothetical protein